MIPNDLIKEVIYGEVIAKANHYMSVPDGNGQKRIIKDKFIRSYEDRFIKQCQKYKNRQIDCHFALYCHVFYKNPLHDLDNSLKTILDCLQYVKAITDDKLCVEIHATKSIDHYRPRVEFAIKEYQKHINFIDL